MPRLLERRADRADAAVHHVRRGDDVGAGLGLDQRLLDEDLDRVVVDDVAGLVDQAVVAVRGIGVERDVGQHADLGHRILDRVDRPADQVVAVERFLGALGAKLSGVLGNKRDARDAEVGRLARLGADAGRCSSG